MQDGTPILCKRCGGNAALDATLTLCCPYCGASEQLPQEAEARMYEVRSRLRLAAAQVAQLGGTEAALGRVFEEKGAFWRVMAPFAFILFVSVFYAAMNLRFAFDAPESVRLQLMASALMSPMFIGGIAFSFPIALMVGRFMYARSVRPLLRARPPLYPGAPMRCRACTGPLPLTRDAKVTCAYCNTTNVMGVVQAQDTVKRLEEEAAQYRARASGAVAGASKAGLNMTRVLIVCFVLTYVSVIGSMMIVQKLL
jgi:LSD1 subclass zinc finger protein